MRLQLLVILTSLPTLLGAQGFPTGSPLPTWVQADGVSRTVVLDLVAGGGGALSGVTKGDIQIVVPVGWTVKIEWRNADSIPHSFIVQQEREKLPERAGEPAFINAFSRTPVVGIAVGGRDRTQFTVDTPGWYWILCGVPGHAIAGEYISLRVDPIARSVSAVMK